MNAIKEVLLFDVGGMLYQKESSNFRVFKILLTFLKLRNLKKLDQIPFLPFFALFFKFSCHNEKFNSPEIGGIDELPLKIMDAEIDCYILEDGTPIFNKGKILIASKIAYSKFL